MKQPLFTLFSIVLLGAGMLGGWFIAGLSTTLLCQNHSYINADFACGTHHTISKAGYITLEHTISELIAAKQAAGEVVEVSVYFRDLHNGPTFGINEDEVFAPASLLKLPVILTYFSLTEEDPMLFGITLAYSNDLVGEYYVPVQIETVPTGLVEGEMYPIKKLMYHAIAHSDNLSYYLILNYINTQLPNGSEKILRTFQELGIIDPRDFSEETVSVRGYASVLRALYNASYLSIEDSEEVLAWLVEATFDKGLAAGVPAGIPVANKFGERELGDGVKQLHDCGIIYYPGNPYLLCIMTKGMDRNSLSETTAIISRLVYEEVVSREL